MKVTLHIVYIDGKTETHLDIDFTDALNLLKSLVDVFCVLFTPKQPTIEEITT